MSKEQANEISEGILLSAGNNTRAGASGKVLPKAMLPIGRYPMLHRLLQDKVEAGISPNTIVVSDDNIQAELIKRYLEPDEPRFEAWRQKGLSESAESVERLISMAQARYVKQPLSRYGTAVAVREALVLSEMNTHDFFEVSYGDDLFWREPGEPSQIEKLADTFRALGKSVLTIMKVPPKEAHKYGVPVLGEEVEKDVFRIKAMEEKPDKPKSRYAQFGSQILQKTIESYIDNLEKDEKGELVLATAVSNFAEDNEVYGVVHEGRRYDTGSEDGYIRAFNAYSKL